MEDSSAPLSIRDVSKRYGQTRALEQVSFNLQAGEIFGLIGLNGAGKTTLIKTILHLARADSGDIRIFNLPAQEDAARRQLSYLPEKFQPSRYLSGREFLSLSLSYYGNRLDVAAAREMAVALDLNPDRLKDRVGTYSKGMGQKLGLIAGCLVDVPLLILDEPMSGLDPRARILLKRQLLALKEKGRTIFFSSHILSDIDEVCDRIGVIHQGRLLYCGTPLAFKQTYAAPSLEQSFLKAITPQDEAA